MKRRITPILTIAIALILVSGLAYAAKKKVQIKSSDLLPDTLSEEETFKAELLNATEDRESTLPDIDVASSEKFVPASGYVKTKAPIANQTKK